MKAAAFIGDVATMIERDLAEGLGFPGEQSLSPARQAALMDQIYRRGDRMVAKFIALHTLIALALASFYQTWLVTGIVSVCAVGMFALAVSLLPRSFVTRCVAGVSLQIFVVLHIYQLHGLGEMHFFFFTSFTMLIVYQDWRCMWPGALGLIGQHLAFALMHNAGIGAGLYFYEEDRVGFAKLFFHFSLALGQVGICGYWAYLLRKQTLASAVQNASLRALSDELRGSERKFRALLEHAQDVTTVVDKEGVIRYESPATVNVLGYPPETRVGGRVFDHLHPDDHAQVAGILANGTGVNEPGASPVAFRYRHGNGAYRVMQALSATVDPAAGGLVINSRDVTERYLAEREATRRAHQQQATSELARHALAGQQSAELFDLATGLVSRSLAVEFAYIAERLEDGDTLRPRAVVGFPRDPEWELAGGALSQGGFTLAGGQPVIAEDFAAETRFALAPAARAAGVRSGLSVVIASRTKVYGVLVAQSSQPGRFTSDDITFLSAVADILSSALERRRAEEAMRAAKAEAERANAAKSEFLSRMSHELRTPLNAILGFSQLLEMGDLGKKSLESLGHITRAGRHLLGLIDEVLAISRIEAGRINLSLEPVSLASIVGECMTLVGRQAEAAGIRCENLCTAERDCGHLVHADRQRLRQVLLNFLSNAVKYNRPGGRVEVSYRLLPGTPVQSDAAAGVGEGKVPPAAGTWVSVEVTDTGHGLTAEDIGRLFTPFERLKAERTAVEGTGLGLALSKVLAEAMGGRIGVDSTPGTGSTFRIQLPLADDPLPDFQAQVRPLALPMPRPTEAGGTVLYIEDNLSNLRLIEMMLEERPHCELLSAQQGTLGLEIARGCKPDLILLDLHLPDIPGWEVLARLQADDGLRDIPVVIISADATAKQIDKLKKMGVSAYITKPIDVEKLMRAIDEHVSKSAACAAA